MSNVLQSTIIWWYETPRLRAAISVAGTIDTTIPRLLFATFCFVNPGNFLRLMRN